MLAGKFTRSCAAIHNANFTRLQCNGCTTTVVSPVDGRPGRALANDAAGEHRAV